MGLASATVPWISTRQFGLEGAQVVLGHAALGVTQVYAERDFEKAARIISQVG